MIGNCLQDNWYMGRQPVIVETIDDLFDRLEGFAGSFKLLDSEGNQISIRMGDVGCLIIEGNPPD